MQSAKRFVSNIGTRLKRKWNFFFSLLTPFYRLAQRLLEKETLSLPDIVNVLGPRPYPHKQSILDYLEELRDREKKEEMAAKAREIEDEENAKSEDSDEDGNLEEGKDYKAE